MRIVTRVILSFLVCVGAFAQTKHEFEVASIRQTPEQPPAQISVGLRVDGAQVRYTYLSLKDYVSLAYNVRPNQIVAPDWLASQRFDISAKIPEGSQVTQVGEMLQNLLVDRFKIRFHREPKEFNVYAIAVAKTGLKMKELPPDPENDRRPDGPVNISAGGSGAGAIINLGGGSFFGVGATAIEGKKVSMAVVADMLTRMLDRPVVDQTNLKGNYDLVVDLTPEDRNAMLIRSAVAAGVVLPPQALRLLDTGSTDSLAAGFQKVGLAFESRKLPLEVLVVDSMERTPTEN